MTVKKLLIAFIVLLGFTACSKFSKIQKSESVQERYNAALAYYEKKDYYRAGVLFEDLVPLIKGTAEAEKTQLYYGYCQFYQKQYVLSAYYFKRFAENFPRSEFVEEALYMEVKSLYLDVPEYTLDQTNNYSAQDRIQAFFRQFPKTKYSQECNDIVDELRKKLEQKAYENTYLYYKLRDYKAAIIAIDVFKAEYPLSIHVEDFAFLKVNAQYELAKISIDSKKEDRFYQAIEYHQNFIDQYPNSKFVKKSESIYTDCNKQIELVRIHLQHHKS